MSYITPEDRHQVVLFQSLDSAIDSDHIVRLLDVIVDQIVEADPDFFLDRGKSHTGRPAYHPSVFLKLYLYGAMNRINSSRRLERECKRNVELMWLLGKLAPDFKTIADYRKDQGEQIRSVFFRVNLFLKEQGLIQGKISSIDGSKIRAYARQSVSKASLEKLLAAERSMLEQYLATLAAEDQAEDQVFEEGDSSSSDHRPTDPPSFTGQESPLMETKLMKAIGDTQQAIGEMEDLLGKVVASEQQAPGAIPKRYCTTDPDARMMKGNEGKQWYYNLISSVDGAHGIICDIEATSSPTDTSQLIPALFRLRDRMGIIPQIQLADAGFGPLPPIIQLREGKVAGLAAVECFIPVGNSRRDHDQQHRLSFIYHPQEDHYTCSEGQHLFLKQTNKWLNGAFTNVYQATDCSACSRKPVCSPKSKRGRTVHRYLNQQARDDYQLQMETKEAKLMRSKRMSLSEHPFGILKLWMGKLPITMRGRKKVNTQVAIFATAYNLRRSTQIKSVEEMIQKAKEYEWKKLSNQIGDPNTWAKLIKKLRRWAKKYSQHQTETFKLA